MPSFLEIERSDSNSSSNMLREGKDLLTPARKIHPVSETMAAYIETLFSGFAEPQQQDNPRPNPKV